MIVGYSTQEILSLYRTARDKKEQIRILADLTVSNEDEIRALLLENGIDPDERQTDPNENQKNRSRRLDSGKREEILLAWQEGLSAGQISEKIGVSKSAVYDTLKRAGADVRQRKQADRAGRQAKKGGETVNKKIIEQEMEPAEQAVPAKPAEAVTTAKADAEEPELKKAVVSAVEAFELAKKVFGQGGAISIELAEGVLSVTYSVKAGADA